MEAARHMLMRKSRDCGEINQISGFMRGSDSRSTFLVASTVFAQGKYKQGKA